MEAESTELYKVMRSYGINHNSATQLLKEHPPVFIADKVDVLEYLLSEEPHRISSPAGFLYQSIQNDYIAPINYRVFKQREQDKEKAAEYRTKLKNQERQKQVIEVIHRIHKLIEQAELEITSNLAIHMTLETEVQLNEFIRHNRKNHLRSPDGYNLRSPKIERKHGDYLAGFFFERLRVDFFKRKSAAEYSGLDYKDLVARDKTLKSAPDDVINDALRHVYSKSNL